MDYSALLGRAWQLTMRHRFLWVLGLFAATSVGSCGTNGGTGSNWRGDSNDLERVSPDVGQAGTQVANWLASNLGFIVGVAIFLALLGLLVTALAFISQGAMAKATYDLAEGRETTLGQAWRSGIAHVWRYVGLWLLMIALGIALFLAFTVFFGGGAILALNVRSLQGPLAILGAILGVLLVLIAIPLGIALSVIVAYAQRAIVVNDLGPWAALGAGYRLLRANLRPSFIVWLISIALGFGTAFVGVFAAIVLAIPLGGIGFILWSLGQGMSLALGLYAVLALITFVGLLWLLSGVVNAFFWNVWTLTYLQLSRPQSPSVPQV